MNPVLQKLANGLIVSVQASRGEPLNHPEMLAAMAECALLGGACGLRMAQVENIRYFKERYPEVPVIGITKPDKIPENAHELVYITPDYQDVAMLAPYAEIVALDATMRPRPGGENLADIVRQVRQDYPDLLLMADVATLDEGLNADRLGFDLISTTLSGYTVETLGKLKGGPDFELLARLMEQVEAPVILEGRLWEPYEVTQAFELGAFAVVIGSAISRPHEITRRFKSAIP